VLTDTLQSRARSRARNFALAAIAYSVMVFGLLKMGWMERHVVLPFTQWQGRVAASAIGAPVLPVDVTLACSGADAFALCAGAILAYPATWTLRLGGTAVGFALILILNSIRIGTLGRVADSPLLFQTLHVYVWPAFLILAIAGYVFGWMRLANAESAPASSVDASPATPSTQTRAFVIWAVLFVLLFVAASPLYLQSGTVLIVAGVVARSAAAALGAIGMAATASTNVLWTSKGGFEVTQECISTPLIPLYFAALMAFAARWRWRLLGVAAAVPLFFGLAIARLLVVALPAVVIGSPLFLIHAFYQFVLAAVVVCGAVAWKRGAGAWRVSLVACLAGVVIAFLVAPVYAAMRSAFAIDIPFNDAQGAMAALPAFQAGLFVALSIATMPVLAWRVLAGGIAALAVVQTTAFAVLYAVSQLGGLTPQIRDVRAWAIAAPLAIVLIGLIAHERPRR
jgi:exosortase/archaeosortase family protein